MGDNDCKVFIYNLPWDVDWPDLKATFRKAGNVKYANVMKEGGPHGKSKGCGVVEFETPAEAQTAIDMFNQSDMGGRKVYVRRDIQNASERTFDHVAGSTASKRPASDDAGNGMGSKRSRMAYNDGDGYGGDQRGYNDMSGGDYGMMQSGMGGRGANGAAVPTADAGMGMGMGMGRRRAAATGMFGEGPGNGAGTGMGAMGMGMGAGMGGGAGMSDMGMMGRGGMPGMDPMYGGGFGGRGRDMDAGMMPGYEPGMDGGMAGGYGEMPFAGGFGRGAMDMPRGGPGFGGADPSMLGRKVFVTNLNYSTTWQEVKDHFKTCGNITYVSLLKDKEDPTKSKGCCIVEFEGPEEAMQAIQRLNQSELGGRRITVREDQRESSMQGGGAGMMQGGMQGGPGMRTGGPGAGGAQPFFNKPPPPGAVQLVVHGLPFSYEEMQLKDMMREAGQILRCDVKRDHVNGRSKGFGTVLFETEEAAESAISLFHGSKLHGRTITVQKDRFA